MAQIVLSVLKAALNVRELYQIAKNVLPTSTYQDQAVLKIVRKDSIIRQIKLVLNAIQAAQHVMVQHPATANRVRMGIFPILRHPINAMTAVLLDIMLMTEATNVKSVIQHALHAMEQLLANAWDVMKNLVCMGLLVFQSARVV